MFLENNTVIFIDYVIKENVIVDQYAHFCPDIEVVTQFAWQVKIFDVGRSSEQTLNSEMITLVKIMATKFAYHIGRR